MKIYEVIRVINSNVLFLSDHIDRLRNSLMFYNKVSLNMNKIYNNIFNIIQCSEESDFNIRIEIDIETLAYHFEKVKGIYPTAMMYERGVSLVTYDYVRENPQVKLEVEELRSKTNAIKKKKKVYEVLYVNDYKVYECSTSNIFFIKGKKVYTSNSGDVLKGVTRLKVMELCADLGYEVVEQDLFLKDINKMRAAFITGTSKHVLPVKNINLKKYNVNNKLLRSIMKAFDKLIDEDIN